MLVIVYLIHLLEIENFNNSSSGVTHSYTSIVFFLLSIHLGILDTAEAVDT